MRDPKKAGTQNGSAIMPVTFAARWSRVYSSSIAIVCVLGSTAACTRSVVPGPRDVRIAPTKVRYSKGDTVRVLISNESDRVIEFSVCSSELQRFSSGIWTSILLNDPSGPSCGDNLTTQAPHQTSPTFIVVFQQSSIALPQSLSAGTYRFVIPALYHESPRIALSLENRQSAAFEVQ